MQVVEYTWFQLMTNLLIKLVIMLIKLVIMLIKHYIRVTVCIYMIHN